jgi:CBS domain-containing protein
MPRPAAQELADGTCGFLRAHVPFDRMDPAHVQRIAAAAALRYHAPGDTLLAPGDGAPPAVLVIHRGRVQRIVPAAYANPGETDEPLQAGEMFPVTAVLDRRPVAYTYRALGDVFCLEIDAGLFRELAAASEPLREFCSQRLRALLEQSRAALQARYTEASSAEQSMTTPLERLLHRPPVAARPDTPVAEVLEAMRRERVGSVAIAGEDGRPLGIFTERDVVDRAARDLLDRRAPIGALMTAAPVSLPHTATVGDAALEMARRPIRHVVVTREGRLAGVVSQRELFSLQRLSFFRVSQRIDAAADIDALAAAAADIRQLARNLLAQGVAAEPLTQFISELNDHVVQRALELARAREPIDDLAHAWIALGSEGRREQTLATDQDNGIVFVAPADGSLDEARGRLVAYARRANDALDRCGFPLCKGGIMASNPRWCLSADEWRARFGDWLRTPLPAALLHANIFFDLRSIGANEPYVAALREWLARAAPANRVFLHLMAKNALETRPPLGWFGALTGSGRGSHPQAIDLKLQGSRLFVDAARVLALAHGVTETGTAARLRAVAARGAIPRAEAEASVDAFHILQQLRLRLQFGDPAGVADNPNAVLPERLNDFDRRVLKEAFFQARRLQQKLALDHAS